MLHCSNLAPSTFHLIVKERDGLPCDALSAILLLLSPECELDKYLLQSLIHVIDAQLFEPVVLKYWWWWGGVESVGRRDGEKGIIYYHMYTYIIYTFIIHASVEYHSTIASSPQK